MKVFCFLLALIALACPTLAAESKSVMPAVLADSVIQPSFNGTPDLIFGLFIGVILTASIYLFFIWVVIHDKGQVFLMLLLSCLAINMVSTNDSMAQFLGLYSAHMRTLLQTYSMILAFFFSLFFTYHFLEVETSVPWMQTPLFISAGLLGLLLAFTAFDQGPVYFILPTLGVLSIGIVLITGLVAIQSGTSGVISHIIAFSSLLLGSMATPLHDLGYLPDMETAKSVAYLGFSVAAVLFAIVIAGQFAARQEEKEKALETSNERFLLAAKGSNEGLFDWDRLTNNLYVSEQFRRILGLHIDTLPKTFRYWMKLVYPSDRLVIVKALRRLRNTAGNSTISFEYRVTINKTERRWIHTKMIAVKNFNGGSIIRLVGSKIGRAHV